MRRYIWNILIAIDQLGNALLAGDPDETISSRAAKNRHKWYWDALCHVLDFLDKNHSTNSIEHDEGSDVVHPHKH